jgi:hypothetical protein
MEKKWKDLVRQAKAHSGLYCQWKKKKKKKRKKKKKKIKRLVFVTEVESVYCAVRTVLI